MLKTSTNIWHYFDVFCRAMQLGSEGPEAPLSLSRELQKRELEFLSLDSDRERLQFVCLVWLQLQIKQKGLGLEGDYLILEDPNGKFCLAIRCEDGVPYISLADREVLLSYLADDLECLFKEFDLAEMIYGLPDSDRHEIEAFYALISSITKMTKTDSDIELLGSEEEEEGENEQC